MKTADHVQRQTQFPHRGLSGPRTLDDERPIFLEGMKVLFEETAGLYPVTLEKMPYESARATEQR